MGYLLFAKASVGGAVARVRSTLNATATVTAPSGDVQPVGIPGNWSLFFSDDFNGSTLDLTKWKPNWYGANDTSVSPPVNTAESAAYDPAMVTVSGGRVHFSLINTPLTVGGKTYPHRSGIIVSDGQTNGNFVPTSVIVVEAELTLEASSGVSLANWPAFWLDGQPTWPTHGEFDIIEGLDNGSGVGVPRAHFHYPGGGPGLTVPAGSDYTGSHIYSVKWTLGDKCEFFYDGVSIGTITPRGTGYALALSSAQFIIVTLADRPGVAGPAKIPGTMSCDYVRVWQLV